MHKALLILHFVGVAAGVGTAMFMAMLGVRMSGVSGVERGMVNLHAFKASMLGEIGLVLLLVSGIGLAAINPGYMAAPLFWPKMVLVALLTGFLIVLRRTGGRITRGELDLVKRMPVLGAAILLIGLSIIVIAVLAFG